MQMKCFPVTRLVLALLLVLAVTLFVLTGNLFLKYLLLRTALASLGLWVAFAPCAQTE
jgi:hypothetical protein